MRILIVACFFPPQNAIASLRPYSWAKYWSRAGHDVQVITIAPDMNRPDLNPLPFDGFKVLEVPPSALFVKLRSLMRRGTGLQSGGLTTVRLEDSARSPKLPIPRKNSSSLSPTKRAFRWILDRLRAKGFLSSTRMPDQFDLWVNRAIAHLPSDSFDVIVSTFGPYAAHIVGWQAKKKNPHAVWVADFRDLWTRNHTYAGIGPFTYVERWLERFLLRRCDLVTTVSEPLAALFRNDHPQSMVEVIPNGIDLEDLLKLDPERAFPLDGKRRILYTGSLHPVQRDARPILESLKALAPDLRSQIEIIFIGPNVDMVKPHVDRLALEANVKLLPPVSRPVSLRMQRDADVLLFIEQAHSAERDGVMTGKLYEYLASQRPIWAIGVEPASRVGTILSRLGCGGAFGSNREALIRALERLANEGAERVDLGGALKEFDREYISNNFISMLESKLMAGKRSGVAK